ncbi:MAG: hypothetical protein QME83_14660 [Thermodesulfobacteriota bacterium]|nr:hypothetical protein [Thermodesulfobacteriota bacterium]
MEIHGSLSNSVMTEWTPEGQADLPAPPSVGTGAGRQARLRNL